jgi:hypothetical protein
LFGIVINVVAEKNNFKIAEKRRVYCYLNCKHSVSLERNLAAVLTKLKFLA